MTFALVFSLALLAASPVPFDGPAGLDAKAVPSANVLGIWTAPTTDPDLVQKFRSSITLLTGQSTIDGEETSRDKQIAQLGGTLERDRPVRCGGNDGRWIEYVLTKPAVDSVVLMIQKSPTELWLAIYDRPVGALVDPSVTAWFQHLCGNTISTII